MMLHDFREVWSHLNAVPDALAQTWQGKLDASTQMLQGWKPGTLAPSLVLLYPLCHRCCNLHGKYCQLPKAILSGTPLL